MLRNVFLRLSSAGHPSFTPKFLAGMAMVATLTSAPQAQAQFFFFDDYRKPKYRQVPPPQPRHVKRTKRIEAAPAQAASPKKSKKPEAPEAEVADAPLYAVVSIDDQHVSIYGSNGLIERSDVSTGTADHPTPTGVFAIIQKERWHESNIYSGSPMPLISSPFSVTANSFVRLLPRRASSSVSP